MNWNGLIQMTGMDRAVTQLVAWIWKYFRVHVSGVEHLPKEGPLLVIPNHSGFSGLDAVLLLHFMNQHQGRAPKVLAHRFFFHVSPIVKAIAERYGLREATYSKGLSLLRENESILMFPEAENGNFKPTSERYRLQPFHSGFARLAAASKAKVVPCLIVGAEESFLNWGSIDLSRFSPKLKIPLPVTLLPLPSQWHIRFYPPIDFSSYTPEEAENPERMHAVASDLRKRMQKDLNALLKERSSIFF